jgi:hypothetical protein
MLAIRGFVGNGSIAPSDYYRDALWAKRWHTTSYFKIGAAHAKLSA